MNGTSKKHSFLQNANHPISDFLLRRFFLYQVLTAALLLQFAGSSVLLGQSHAIRIQVALEVSDSSGLPLRGAYGRLHFLNQPSIVAFGISNDSGLLVLSTSVPVSTDSIELQVSAVAHLPFVVRMATHQNGIHSTLQVLLKAAPNTLPNAVVVAPAQWQRGDTTFYRVSSFLQQGDKKLKDVLAKLPGFELSASRGLLFKGRPVDKITIEGEEIFADKLELMISSFPVHVLEQIQAIENQTDDKLLKGLVSDNKIFVNLGLKKGKLSTAFGDTEMAIGTAGRYRFFPTLFGLYNAIKFGLIVDYNSTGNGLTPNKLAELYKGSSLEMLPFTMQHSTAYVINHLANERYIQNRLFDHRFQANIPFSKKVNSITEVNAVFDRQRQNIQTDESVLNGNSFVLRNISSRNEFLPAVMQCKEQLDWSINNKQSLVTAFIFHSNSNLSRQQTLFASDSVAPDAVGKQLQNSWTAFQLSAKYSLRSSNDRAVRISLLADYANAPQRGVGFSEAYPLIFGMPQGLTYLQLQRSNEHYQVKLTADFINRTKGNIIYSGIEAKQQMLTPSNRLSFSEGMPESAVDYPGLAYAGKHQLQELAVYRRQAVAIGKLQVAASFTTGWQAVHRKENSLMSRKQYWLVKTNIEGKRFFSRQAFTSFTVDYQQSVAQPQKWNEALLPLTLEQYTRNANGLQAMKELSLRWGTHASLSKRISIAVSAYARRNFSPTALYNQLQGFVQVSVDSITCSPLNTFGAFASWFWSFPKQRFSLRLQGNFFNTRFYQLQLGKLSPGISNYVQLSTEGHKQWANDWSLKGNAGVHFVDVRFGSSAFNQNKVTNVFWKLEVNKRFKKQFSVGTNANQLFNNLGTINNGSILLADCFISYQPAKQSFDFSIRCENIFNQKGLKVFNSGQSGFAYTLVPLIGRNLMVEARFTF